MKKKAFEILKQGTATINKSLPGQEASATVTNKRYNSIKLFRRKRCDTNVMLLLKTNIFSAII